MEGDVPMPGASHAVALERVPQTTVDPICQIEENLVEALAAWGRLPRAEAHREIDRLEYITHAPYPLFNGVARARLPAEDLDGRIDAVLAPFRQRRLPMMWWVGPHSEPVHLGESLEAHGLIHAGADVGAEDGDWRDAMSELLDADTTGEPRRRERLTAAFNRGYRSFASIHTTCTAAARTAEERYRNEGATLAAEIAARFGN